MARQRYHTVCSQLAAIECASANTGNLTLTVNFLGTSPKTELADSVQPARGYIKPTIHHCSEVVNDVSITRTEQGSSCEAGADRNLVSFGPQVSLYLFEIQGWL